MVLGVEAWTGRPQYCTHMVILAYIPCEYKQAKAELRCVYLWIILRGACGHSWFRCIAELFCCVWGVGGIQTGRRVCLWRALTGTSAARVRFRAGRRSALTSGLEKFPRHRTLWADWLVRVKVQTGRGWWTRTEWRKNVRSSDLGIKQLVMTQKWLMLT
jgi:hypothetical protein